MARRRINSRNDSSLIALAMDANWQVTAILSAASLAISFLFIPLFASQNIFVHALLGGAKPFLIIVSAALALVSIFNFQREKNTLAEYYRQSCNIEPASQIKDKSPNPDRQVNDGMYADNSQRNEFAFSKPINPSRPASWSIDLLHQIEWKLFEDLSAAYYQEKGIRAELTKLGADGGIDIKLFQDDSGKPTSLVQCKAWNSKMVGIKPIREFLGVMSHEKISKGFFMASGDFTNEAKEFAKANGIVLIDGTMFLAMIQRLPDEAKQRLLELATFGDYTTPSCPSCGVKMVKRNGKGGEFWGCINFPRGCRQKLHLTSAQKSGTNFWQSFH